LLTSFAPGASPQSPDPEKTPPPEHGIDYSVLYDGETVSDVSGGARRGSVYHGSLQGQVSFDLDNYFGWRDTTASIYAILLHGERPENLSGAAQGVSSFSGPSGLHLDEAWLQRNFDGGRLSLLGGRYDVNSEFYRVRSASALINPSFGIGPEFAQSGPASAPAFPNTSAAVRVQYKATSSLVLRGALLNARPFGGGTPNATTVGGSGALIVSEADYLERPEELKRRIGRLRTGRFAELAPYENKLAVGLWHYTATFEDLSAVDAAGNPQLHHGSSGAYVLVDRSLTKKTAAFLQLGIGDARIDRFGSYVGLGVHVAGFSRARPDDEIALGLASARNGGHYMDQQFALGNPVTRTENIWELTYVAKLSDAIALQPDVQYIVHPNTDASLRNALNLLLRLEITF
jgi:porin